MEDKKKNVLEETEDTSRDAGELNSQDLTEDPFSSKTSKKKENLGVVNFSDVKIKKETSLQMSRDSLTKQIGHPDHILNRNKSSEEESSDSEDDESEEDSKSSNNDNDNERDENFIIESDNINDKLYSSETEDEENLVKKPFNDKSNINKEHYQRKIGDSKQTDETHRPAILKEGKTLSNLSSSSISTSTSNHNKAAHSIKPGTNFNEVNKPHIQAYSANTAKKSFALNLRSDSESHDQEDVDEFDISGPQNDLAEDDFWN